MYNEKIKREFIEVAGSGNSAKFLFKITENIEAQQETDLYFIPYDEVIDAIFEFGNVWKYTTLYDYLYSAKQYKEWIVVNGIFDQEEITLLGVSELELKKKYANFISSLTVRSFNEMHEKIIDNISYEDHDEYMVKGDYVKIFLLLLYNGIHEQDIWKLSMDDLLYLNDDIVIKTERLILQIQDEELKQLLKKRKEIKNYYLDRGRGIVAVPLSNLVINFGTDSESSSKKNTTVEMKKIIDKYNSSHRQQMKVNKFHIYVCGTIRLIKEQEDKISTMKKVYEFFDKRDGGVTTKIKSNKTLIRDVYMNW